LLEPTPRIYQLTPDIPDRRRATKQEQVRPQIWPTASKRVNSPPVGTFSPASDVTDEANSNSKPQSGSGVTVAPLPPALLLLVKTRQRASLIRAHARLEISHLRRFRRALLRR
jgi:hypothetical protein